MATRIYLPSSGTAAVTPADWEFGEQINPLTLPGLLSPDASTLTDKVEATGTTSPILRAMYRYVIGPLKAQSISGTITGQMQAIESNNGANATLAIAAKIIQPGGADRAVLLAPTASDLINTTPPEFTTSVDNRRYQDASENNPITLSTQSASEGDYLVVEIGFRAATTVSRNITFRTGCNASSGDLPNEANGTTGTTYRPWVEFSANLQFAVSIPLSVGSIGLSGALSALALATAIGAGPVIGLTGQPGPLVDVQAGVTPIQIPLPEGPVLGLTGQYVDSAFLGPDTGTIQLTGYEPQPFVDTGGGPVEIPIPSGSITFVLQGTSLAQSVGIPQGSVALTPQGTSLAQSIITPSTSLALTPQGTVALAQSVAVPAGTIGVISGAAPLLVGGVASPAGAIALTAYAPTLGLAIAIPSSALAFTSYEPSLPSVGNIPLLVGSVALTGYAPQLLSTCAVPTGLLAITGNAPGLGRTTAPIPVGAIVLTPTTAVIAQGIGVASTAIVITGSDVGIRFLGPDTGSITLTSYAPVVRTSIAISSGTLAFTGYAPIRAGTFAIPVPTGAITLTGYNPNTGGAIGAQPDSGAIVLTAYAPNLVARTTLLTGTIITTTYAPTVAIGATLGAGSVALTSTAPTLQTGIAIPTSVVALSTYAPTLRLLISVPPATLTLVGWNGSIGGAQGIPIPTGVLEVSTYAPTLAASTSISVGAITITSYASVVMAGRQLPIPASSIVLSTTTAALAQKIVVPTGAIEIVGYNPISGGMIGAAPPAGSVALVGYAPSIAVGVDIPAGAVTFITTILAQQNSIVIPAGALTLTGYRAASQGWFPGNVDQLPAELDYTQPQYTVELLPVGYTVEYVG